MPEEHECLEHEESALSMCHVGEVSGLWVIIISNTSIKCSALHLLTHLIFHNTAMRDSILQIKKLRHEVASLDSPQILKQNPNPDILILHSEF